MVVAAVLGLGLGVAGGVMLGGQLFKLAEPKEYHFLDVAADHDENVADPLTQVAVKPEVRGMLPFMPEWVNLPDYEQVNWVNSTIEWLWPSMTRAIHKMVASIVHPILADLVAQQAMLDALDIDVFDIGPHAPKFGGMKIYDTRDDEVILEAPLIFGSTMKLHISARVRVGPVSIYVPLKVENVAFKATARITIRPLVDTLPCLGAISITLTESPYVDLVLKAITDFDIMSMPYLHDTVCLIIKKVAEGICVYPNTIPIPLMPNSGLPHPPCGMLELDVQRIENLRGKGDLIGSGDPFVRVSVVHVDTKDGTVLKQGSLHDTKVMSGRKPVFNESMRILLDELGEGHEILFEVLDHDLLSPPTLMCEYHLPLDPSPDGPFSFLRQPGQDEELVVQLQPPPVKGGFGVAKVSRMVSFRRAPKAGSSMGQLFLNCSYVPFYRTEADMEDNDNPAAALESQQSRQAPRKVNSDMKGVLIVNLLRCQDLPVVGGTCDSFVELKLTDPEREKPDIRTTEVVLNEASPRFRQKFEFVYVSATSTLQLTVFDKPGLFEMTSMLKPWAKANVALGKLRLPVKDVVRATRIKDIFPLQEAEQGDVHLILEWIPVERDH